MTLGEALSKRARIAQQMNDLRGRIKNNSLVQEDQKPVEDPNELLSEYEALSREFQELVKKITYANANAEIGDEKLLDLLQERECLIRIRNIYTLAATSASPGSDRYRYMRSEIAMIPAVDVAEMRRREESLTKQIIILDAQIQKKNWQIEI